MMIIIKKKKMTITPRSRIKGMLRQIFLKSNERAEALKRDHYTCCDCGKKQSVKKGYECKVQVHHKRGIKIWNELIEMIYEHLLCSVNELETLCVDCHSKREHNEDNGNV